MSRTVTVTLSDDLYRQLAQLAKLNVNEVATEAIELSFLPGDPSLLKPVDELPDKEILKLTQLQMSRAEDRRLTQLLTRQQKGTLTSKERGELWTLMQIYRNGLLRKAQALAEAVRRGLSEPLTP